MIHVHRIYNHVRLLSTWRLFNKQNNVIGIDTSTNSSDYLLLPHVIGDWWWNLHCHHAVFCMRVIDLFITRFSKETVPNHLVFTIIFKPFIYISSKSLVNSICLFGFLTKY